MDIRLPDIDGFDVTTILKSDPSTRDIPVIFLTVMEGEARARGMAMGAAAFYSKPAHYEQVAEKISALVGPAIPGIKGKSILLVDDDPDILRYLEADLTHHDYRVTCARSGEEAKTCLEESVPDLLILDLRLPGITGYDILKLVRSDPHYAQMAVIVITASEGDQSRLRVMQMGATSFLRKPITPELLHREIGKVIH